MRWFWTDPLLPEVDRKLNIVIGRLNSMEKLMSALTDAVDALAAEVEKNTQVDQSAIVLIQGLADQIAAVATDPAKVTELAAKLKASTDALAAAVAANTVAEPVAPVEG
jgi:hypothetical protein